MDTEGKRFWQSKTFWFGALYLAINIAGLFGWETYQPDPQTVEIVGIVVAVLVIVLRFITRQPIR